MLVEIEIYGILTDQMSNSMRVLQAPSFDVHAMQIFSTTAVLMYCTRATQCDRTCVIITVVTVRIQVVISRSSALSQPQMKHPTH